jgi:HPt (histidine-containing phosphotransfer) domain-containing protein
MVNRRLRAARSAKEPCFSGPGVCRQARDPGNLYASALNPRFLDLLAFAANGPGNVSRSAPLCFTATFRLDRIALDATLTFLPPNEVTANLQVLREFQAQMLQLLDQPTEPALLTQAAHSLASNAGMFGFAALCTVARNFEHAIAGDAPEVDRLGQLMRTEIGVGLTTLDALEHERRIQPALARAA